MKARRSLLSTQALIILIALGLLWLAIRDVAWNEVLATLRQIDLLDLVVLAVVDLCLLLTISGRWWLLLYGFGYRLPLRRLVRYRTTVTALSYITPGPQVGGEVLQVYYPVHDHGVPTAVAVAVASVDKTLEFVVNFTFIASGTMLVLIGQHLIAGVDAPIMLALTALLLLPIGVIVAVARGRHPLSGLVEGITRLLPQAWSARLRRLPLMRNLPATRRFLQGLRHTEDLIAWLFRTRPWVLLFTVLVAFLALGLILVEFFLMLRALSLPLTGSQAIGALVLVFFSFLLPVPAGLGAMEASLVLAFTAFGYAPAQAVSLGLLMRARDLAQAGIGLVLGGFHMGAHLQPNAADLDLADVLLADAPDGDPPPEPTLPLPHT